MVCGSAVSGMLSIHEWGMWISVEGNKNVKPYLNLRDVEPKKEQDNDIRLVVMGGDLHIWQQLP